ncbi:MAG: S41 family peptidase [Bacteroidota bacterium]|nr:S41 family peptidase [Bacteroidota bacterium]
MRKIYLAFLLIPVFSISYSQVPNMNYLKLQNTLNIISNAYVDTVNQNKLTEDAIIGMLKELDPHSVYLSKEELKKANEPLTGNFDGIGVQFNLLYDTITVVMAISGGPAEKVGVMAGDKIVKIDGENSTGKKISNSYVMKKLRGEKGTKVTISVFRKGVKGLLDFTITRDKIPLYSIDAAYMATPEIGYIKINGFAATTMKEFAEAIAKLKPQGLKHLILDLRGNGGGYLNIAIELADEFLDDNKVIVFTQGINSPKQVYSATDRGNFNTGKIVVLIDEGSASASEIVTGALQDWDRALVIGRRSFGKGLVQRPFELPDGSAIRLTTARYYTPTGRCIQKSYKDGVDKYYKDFETRYKHGELMHKDSIKFPDSLKYYTPNKRIVYGGGGIMPDIFLPLDTSKNSDYYFSLIRKGIINKFTLSYVDNNRKMLKEKYPDLETFKKNFEIDNKFINDLIEFGEKEGVKKDPKGLETSRSEIALNLKGLIARDFWDMNAYFEITNPVNDVYKKAIEVIQDKTFDKMKIHY